MALGCGVGAGACFSADIAVVAGGLACAGDDDCPDGLACNPLLNRCGQVGVVELSEVRLTPGTHPLGALLVAEVVLSDVPSSVPSVTFADDRGGLVAMALDDIEDLASDDGASPTFVFRHTVNGTEGDGEHPVTLRTADDADGVLIGTWRIDTLPPALVTDTLFVDDETRTITLELRFDAAVENADVALAGSDAAFAVTFQDVGLTATAQVAAQDLDGAYDFDVVVSDDAGNRRPSPSPTTARRRPSSWWASRRWSRPPPATTRWPLT
jgi:hypothetical protein